MNLRSLPLVGHASKEVAPWIEVFARVGFAAKGVLYLTISALAASAALGMGGKSDPDSKQAMQKLFEAPFGRLLVAVVALGLVGYGVWRIIEGVTDPQGRGHGVKGIAHRTGSIVRGVIHLGLAFAAGMLALYREGSGGGGGQIREYVGKVLSTPGGTYAIMAVAAGFLGYGVYQLYKAFKSKLSKQLQLGRVNTLRPWIIGVSRFGIAARGVVFGMIAVLLYRAARDHDPRQAGGLGDSLRHLFVELGKWPYLAIALGLGAYGVYEILNAKYRRIDI